MISARVPPSMAIDGRRALSHLAISLYQFCRGARSRRDQGGPGNGERGPRSGRVRERRTGAKIRAGKGAGAKKMRAGCVRSRGWTGSR